jgi:hypothetical protein
LKFLGCGVALRLSVMRKLSIRGRVEAALTGGIAIACVVALAWVNGSAGSTSSALPLSPALTANFRLLRSSSVATAPRVDMGILSMGGGSVRSPSKRFGLYITFTHQITLSGGVKVWLIPGRTGSCLVTAGPNAGAVGCAGNATFEMRGTEMYQRHGETQRIIGIAPNGLRVTFRLSDGSSIPARLNSENAYVIVRPLSDRVVNTTFTGHGRTISTSTIELRRPLSSVAPA